MSGELQEKPAAAKRRQVISFRRLEGKVDELATIVEQDRNATHDLGVRINTLNLNGSAPALKKLADNAGALLELAKVAPSLVEAVERDTDMRIFWKVLRRLLNPVKPIGAFIWLLFTTIVSAIAWNLVTAARLPHH